MAQKTSNITTATTPSLTSTRRTGSSWTVEVDHPNQDQPLKPSPLDGVEFRPQVNGLPSVRVPIRRDDRWDNANFDSAPMRVWFRGTRVPIDRLVAVEQTPGQTVLVGRGGQQLKSRVQREIQQQESHLLVEDIINNETSYKANVDDPSVNVSEDIIQSVNSETDWQNALQSPPSTLPLEGGGGGSLFALQSLVFREAETSDTASNIGTTQTGGQFNGSEAVELKTTNANVGFNINFDYELPDENVAVQLLFRYPGPDQSNPEVTVSLANSQLGTITANALNQDASPEWYSILVTAGDLPFTTWPASSRQLDVEITQVTGEPIYLDSIAVYDDRYNYNFSTATSGSAPGPELYPDSIQTETSLVNSAFGLSSTRLSSTWDDTSNNQAVAVRAGSQTTYTTATNSTSVQTSFASNKTAVQARFTLSRYSDGRSTTPTQGNQGQSVDSYNLFANVDLTPLVLNETFDGQPVSILNTLADRGDFIWELTYDDDADSLAVQFTKPGQRTVSDTSSPSDFDVEKSTADQVDEVIIRGGGQSIQDEEITANHRTFVALQENNIIQGSTVVQDATSGTTYDRGQDYELRRLSGELKTLSAGNIGNGDTLEIDYQFKVVGSYQSPDYDPSTDQSQVFDLPGLPTAEAAEQTALFLHRQISVPVYTVTVDLSREVGERSLVESRAFDAVPTDGTKKVINSTETPSGTQLQLASRRGVSETFDRLRSRVDEISQQV